MTSPNAVHHIAVSTANIKAQIAFFSDVLGLSLAGLFWMHGVPNAWPLNNENRRKKKTEIQMHNDLLVVENYC